MAAVGIGGVVLHSELKLNPLSLSIRLKKQWNSRTIYGSFAHDHFVGVGNDTVLGKKLGEGSFASVYRVSLARKPSSKGADLMQSREFPYNHLRHCSSSAFENAGRRHQIQVQRNCDFRVKALPDWPLMAVLVEHIEGQRDLITHKSVWHLSDEAMKNVYTFYIMFTVWGCCFFGSTKDPYYDSEQYRGDGGDGTGHWVYEKQEDIEETARAELWREELIEEIEQKVGGLRELEEAGKKEQLVK